MEGRWQGQSDSRLTERGLAQSRQLARALADEPITSVYSSDLGRAVQTAAEIAQFHHLDVTTDIRLREIDTGAWTAKNRAEITAEFPGGPDTWARNPSSMRLPNGETLNEAQARALAFFAERMHGHEGETVVVISHGAVGQTILVNALGGTVEDLWLEHHTVNCQLSRLDWTPAEGLKVIELIDVRHLEDVGTLRGWRTTDAA